MKRETMSILILFIVIGVFASMWNRSEHKYQELEKTFNDTMKENIHITQDGVDWLTIRRDTQTFDIKPHSPVYEKPTDETPLVVDASGYITDAVYRVKSFEGIEQVNDFLSTNNKIVPIGLSGVGHLYLLYKE